MTPSRNCFLTALVLQRKCDFTMFIRMVLRSKQTVSASPFMRYFKKNQIDSRQRTVDRYCRFCDPDLSTHLDKTWAVRGQTTRNICVSFRSKSFNDSGAIAFTRFLRPSLADLELWTSDLSVIIITWTCLPLINCDQFRHNISFYSGNIKGEKPNSQTHYLGDGGIKQAHKCK